MERLRRLFNRPATRFLLLGLPGTLFVVVFLFLPIISVIVFSFWRTESYEIYSDWNLDNYRTVLFEGTYLTFLWRSIVTAFIVTAACLVYAWPVAYFIAKYGGRYRLLLVLALAAPFFTGVVLRLSALQAIMGPIGVINMALGYFGLPMVEFLMFTKIASGIGIAYLYLPFMVTAIYLSLLNFNFQLLNVAKVNGARPWRAFVKVTWPLNWIGTAIGITLVFIPCLAESVTPTFLGGPSGKLYGSVLGVQFDQTGTWALGSAMGVLLFAVCCVVIAAMWMTINLQRSGFTGAGALTMTTMHLGRKATPVVLGIMLALLYVFLFAPVLYLVYTSFAGNTTWPFPWKPNLDAYFSLLDLRAYHEALWNSLAIGVFTALLSMTLSAMGSIAVLKYRHKWRGAFSLIMISPMFVAELLIGISTLIFNRKVLGLPGNIGSAVIANTVHGMSFGFLIMMAQLVRYDWRLDDAAQVFGANPWRTFWHVTAPNIWPAMLGAFVITFLLGFNNLEISFYNLGALPTLPSLAWGSLRYGLEPELFALAALVNAAVFIAFIVIYVLMRLGIVRFGYRGI